MSVESKTKYPGGFDEIEIRQLLDGLVSAHISKAMSGEKMKSVDRIHNLGLIRPFIIHATHLIRSLIEEKEGVWPFGINTEIDEAANLHDESNSPEIPDGCVVVPLVPTVVAMIAASSSAPPAWLSDAAVHPHYK